MKYVLSALAAVTLLTGSRHRNRRRRGASGTALVGNVITPTIPGGGTGITIRMAGGATKPTQTQFQRDGAVSARLAAPLFWGAFYRPGGCRSCQSVACW